LLGSSPGQQRAGAVFQRRGKPLNGWCAADRDISRQYYDWCASWAREWLRVLKPAGSAIVFAGRRLSHRCIAALEDVGFTFKDMLAWVRDTAPHRAQRVSVVFDRRGDDASSREWEGWRVGNLRPVFEPVLWFTRPYQMGGTIATNMLEHDVGAFNEKAFFKYTKGADNVLRISASPNDGGLHPTQKPLRLMQSLVELTTRPGHTVLDPFCGSGTTLLASKMLDRRFIGIESNEKYWKVAEQRLKDADTELKRSLFPALGDD
jgi:site-specific DNA-methyltransferase (adenine-specific)